jgi:hypothetical protein
MVLIWVENVTLLQASECYELCCMSDGRDWGHV